jgi:TonB-dependent starch-binding outer membrane protein SusC
MKKRYTKLLFLLLLFPIISFGQNSLSGVVKDKKTNSSLQGVNVVVQGGLNSTNTDNAGKFKLNNLNKNDKITVSFVGYKNFVINYNGQSNITVNLEEITNELNEVVVQVGYGSVKKKDATGSVSVISSKDFNKGAVLSADQLLVGKVPGIRITNSGGKPDSAPNIRIRGGASLNAENNPLIVIDGVPIDNQNAAGNSNPLTLINPNDIDSFTILKDASATAIYGSRASNGVIIVTTKKGTSGKPQYSFSSTTSIGIVGRKIKMKNGEQFANYIKENNPTFADKLGIPDPNSTTGARIIYNTDWQDVIFRNSISVDNNFSARANLLKKIPFRLSIGYNKTEGVVKTNDYERLTTSLKLSPSFLDNHLKIDLNAKGQISKKNDIDDGGAISGALNMDPTKPVYGDSPDNRFVGYYQLTELNSNQYKTQGPTNPLAVLQQRTKPQKINKLVGNVEIDYKLHFFPDLKAVVNLGIETSRSLLSDNFNDNSIQTYSFNQGTNPQSNYLFNPGESFSELQTVTNKTADAYLIYSRKMTGIVSRFEMQTGHSFQTFVNDGTKQNYQNNLITGLREEKIDPNNPNNRYYNKMALESYFGRSNIDILNRYLFTITFRADASSLFNKANRWGYFPAIGFAWKLKSEKFLENSKSIKDLKLRLGYGITGNSDIRSISGSYPNTPLFEYGDPSGQYLPGISIYNALPFNSNLTWEKTTTTNLGIDFDLFKNNLLNGSVDVYYRKTNDLLAKVPLPPGQSLTNEFTTNVGSLTNKGIEANIALKLLAKTNMSWNLNGNFAYNIGKIEDLKNVTVVQDGGSGIPNGTGNKIAYNAVGEQPYSAWMYEQVYDIKGMPIADVFVDRNKDGLIDDNDRYYISMRPNWTYGFGTTLSYKNLDLTASFRGQVGGKVYNSRILESGWKDKVIPQGGISLNNILDIDLPFKNVNGNIAFSDYFLQDASFLRCENITLGYKFDKLTKGVMIRTFLSVNNLFILTKYTGQDPENFNGIDTNFYPRPRVFSMGINFDF